MKPYKNFATHFTYEMMLHRAMDADRKLGVHVKIFLCSPIASQVETCLILTGTNSFLLMEAENLECF